MRPRILEESLSQILRCVLLLPAMTSAVLAADSPASAPPMAQAASAPAPKLVPAALINRDRLLSPVPHLPELVKARYAGSIVGGSYRICVARDGSVSSVAPVNGIDDADADIIATLRTWRYKPQPALVCFIQEIEFQVDGGSEEPSGAAGSPQKRTTILLSKEAIDKGGLAVANELSAALAQADARDRELDSAMAMKRSANTYHKKKQLAEAESLYKRALARLEEIVGVDAPQVAGCLFDLAVLYLQQKNYPAAEPLLKRMWPIVDRALRPTNPQLLQMIDTIAELYLRGDQYPAAEPLLRRALSLVEKQSGLESPAVIPVLRKLTKLSIHREHYMDAESFAKRALSIQGKMQNADSYQLAKDNSILAEVYIHQGQYGQAELLLQQALSVAVREGKADHPDSIGILHGLAFLYRAQFLFAQAEPYYERALAISEKAGEKAALEMASLLNGLACLHADQGQYERAEPLQKRALALREKVRPPGHSDIANSLFNLAEIYIGLGQLSAAEPLLRRALSMQEKTLGPEHSEVAQIEFSLSIIADAQNRPAEAELLRKRALSSMEKALGSEHPALAEQLSRAARLELRLGKTAAAAQSLLRALRIGEAALRQAVSEPRITALLHAARTTEEAFYSLLLAPGADPALRAQALTLSLLRKGRAAEVGADVNRAVADSLTTPAQRSRFAEWQLLRSQREQLVFAGPPPLARKEHRAQLDLLKLRIESLEQELAIASPRLRGTRVPHWDEILAAVAGKLPGGSALLEVVWTNVHKRPSTDAAPAAERPHYLALLLFPDRRIEVTDLGEAEELDGVVARLHGLLQGRAAAVVPAAQALYQKVFAPLEASLSGVSRLYLSLDGSLYLAPFAALHDGKRYLLDRYEFHYLTSGRDLLRESAPSSAQPALVLADPDFAAAPAANPPAALPTQEAGSDPESSARGLYAQLHTLQRLPGTRKEAQAIARLLPSARVRVNEDATEQALRGAETPRLLHIATHGLLLADLPEDAQPQNPGQSGNTLRGFAPLGESFLGPIVRPAHWRRIENPLSRSALVLAGAGRAQQGGDGQQDGIVTAEEVRSLNLWGTELVTLSACETGRGEVRAGQGVYGLRRAFLVAGAQTVVTSLWRVADKETGELMKQYYEKLIHDHKDRVAALQEAMQVMRRRKPHPYYWAPFVLTGQDGPLTLDAPLPAVDVPGR